MPRKTTKAAVSKAAFTQPIAITTEAYTRILEYADTFGISVESASSKAIMRWMDASGDGAMEIKKRKAKSTLAVMPGGRKAS